MTCSSTSKLNFPTYQLYVIYQKTFPCSLMVNTCSPPLHNAFSVCPSVKIWIGNFILLVTKSASSKVDILIYLHQFFPPCQMLTLLKSPVLPYVENTCMGKECTSHLIVKAKLDRLINFSWALIPSTSYSQFTSVLLPLLAIITCFYAPSSSEHANCMPPSHFHGPPAQDLLLKLIPVLSHPLL